MLYTEQDIDFSRISPVQFEELCLDLLLNLGYKGLSWRRGGADSGRDIEGRFTVNNPLTSSYEEKWFFECKHYSNGLPPEQLYSKVAWADAEKPKHLVIFVSSYLTNGCRQWLETIKRDKPYNIHVIEEKQLKSFILAFPNLVSKYFFDKYLKLLITERNNWLIHDVIPQPETFQIFSQHLDTVRLSIDELAFLWCSSKLRIEEIEQWCSENEPFSLDFVFHKLSELSNTDQSVLSLYKDLDCILLNGGVSNWDLIYRNYIAARLVINSKTKPQLAMYSFVYDNEGEGLEVLLEATGDFNTKVRYMSKRARDEYLKVAAVLYNR